MQELLEGNLFALYRADSPLERHAKRDIGVLKLCIHADPCPQKSMPVNSFATTWAILSPTPTPFNLRKPYNILTESDDGSM
jgi:hypothetical protein